MELVTRANNRHKDWFLAIYCDQNEDFNKNINNNLSLKILLITEGTGIIRVNGEHRSIISPNLIILNEKDTINIDKSADLKGSTIYFHPMAINSKINFKNLITREGNLSQTEIQDIAMLRNFIKGYDNRELSPRTFSHIKEIFDNIDEQLKLQPDGYWPCRARSYLIELIFSIERMFIKTSGISRELTSLNSDIANDIIMFLYNNIHNKVTLNMICNTFCMNKNLVQKYMYTATGYSAITYLKRIRMEVACTLLRDTGIPVNEISRRCGFEDSTNFGRTFKKIVGFTPSDYRATYEINCLV